MYFITLNNDGNILRHPITHLHMFSPKIVECMLCGEFWSLEKLQLISMKPYSMLFCEGCVHDLMYHNIQDLWKLESLRSTIRLGIKNVELSKEYHIKQPVIIIAEEEG